MFALELKNISKTFGEFKANDNINLNVLRGEVHAVLGENGAGKSTLMKIIFGLYQPDSGGEIKFNGEPIHFSSPYFAIKKGIGMVHQHFMLVRPFTVLQNIILGVEPRTWYGTIDYNKARSAVMKISKTYNFIIDPDRSVESISVGMQQRVEIIKTLYRNAELIILDEPTAVLTPQEIIDFYRIVKNLKQQGKTILLITHKLYEIKEIADRCTIIRKGKLIETVPVKDASEEELAGKMVGRKVDLRVKKLKANVGDEVLNISHLNVLNNKHLPIIKDFNLTLRRGEILGVAGIDGNGQAELVEALAGLRKIQSGSIHMSGKEISRKTPREIYENKLALIPEDRQRHGLVLEFKVKENLVLQRIEKKPFSYCGFLINHALNTFSKTMMERFDIRPRNSEQYTQNLSGGNQQKVILAREIANNPDVLVAFQPTRGLDVGAIEYVHQELIKLRDQGKAILLISYELDEIIDLSDRIVVIFNGQICTTINQDTIHSHPHIKEHIGFYMSGGVK